MKDLPKPDKRERYPLKYRGTKCLNCGHPLDISDRYCPQCSQANNNKKRTLVNYIEEFFNTVVAYDSRLLRTLSAMLLHPGKITREYLEGKRMTYTNPFRFLLSLSIIYFLLLSMGSNLDTLDAKGNNDTPNQNATNTPLVGDAVKASSKDSVITWQNPQGFVLFSDKKDSMIASSPALHYEQLATDEFWERIFKKTEFYLSLIRYHDLKHYDEIGRIINIPESGEDKSSFAIARSINRVKNSPGSFLNAILGRLPFATFFFLPVFAIFIRMVYINKSYTYTDNLIFSFHNQSLMFILLTISFLADKIFSISTAGFALLIFTLYLYKAMRTFYGDGRLKTILKFLLLNTIFIILSGIGALALLLGSAFTY
ncbi:DUF3667 domain-containing protein [Zeaxanthinibacter sp. PT1]|uniref:DUF3667 domain-containing protein n=1 Tax=Zeaxanthinibacter TaxID=561554 RepID=UPI00234BFAE9|nr:DUF3667 domain-containing protein [Zeaxanthinibacter sp. PT1]MDC6349938.1 DUF3667 domain-containing protein [Zeaxanthinibacter sp. PT1]